MLLEVRQLSKSFGGVAAVDDASFGVAEGSITALIGPNGAGKTTAFNLISGFMRADSGETRFAGTRIETWRGDAIARAGLVRVFQTPRVLTKMTVIENMMLAAKDQPGERLLMPLVAPRRVAARETAVRDQAMRLIELLRLVRLTDAYAGTLSGGQRKLVELGRALMTEPRMILLDEPMAGVAPVLAEQLLDHIRVLRAERGVTVLVIEHDMDVVMTISDRVIVMDEGHVIAEGTPDEVQRNERVIEAYLGRLDAGEGGVMAEDILAVSGLRAGYGDEDILHGVTLRVPRGSIVAIIGPNGSGKSTLLKTVYGLVPVRHGAVMLFGVDGSPTSLAGFRPNVVTALGLNMVPQSANVFPELSVLENLQIGALPIRYRFREQLEKVLSAVPLLKTMLGKRAATLSGGQRQMLAFGRALMSDPSLLILDEPSAGLAPRIQDEVFAKVKEVNALGVSILMVEQKARQCLAIADYGYVLEQGRNRLEGVAGELLVDPEVIRLYLGAASRIPVDV